MAQCESACLKIEGMWVRAWPASLHCVLEQDTLVIAIVLVQHMKTHPNIAEKSLTGTYRIKSMLP